MSTEAKPTSREARRSPFQPASSFLSPFLWLGGVVILVMEFVLFGHRSVVLYYIVDQACKGGALSVPLQLKGRFPQAQQLGSGQPRLMVLFTLPARNKFLSLDFHLETSYCFNVLF